MAKAKSTEGVFWKRGEGNQLIYFWRIGTTKSKDFNAKRACAEDYVEKMVQRNPKYLELVYDKEWEQIFKTFGIEMEER